MTYENEGYRALDCPRCGQEVRVDLHGERLSFTCRGRCGVDVAAHIDEDQIRGELERLRGRHGTNGAAPEAEPPRPLRPRPADLERVRPIRFQWDRRLPLGYMSLVIGAEGIGKGTLAAWIIAKATRGQLPGDLAGHPVRALIVGDEDSFDSVVVPRLYAAGADLRLVDGLHEDEDELLDIRRDAARLRDLLRDGGYRLVYIDALLDTLGLEVDDWRSKPVRDALRPLRRIARDLDVCVLAALHPNKGSRATFRDLISGTHAFNASSRSSLLLAVHPDDADRRVLVRGKGNLSAAPPSWEFRLEGRDLEINGHGFSLPVVADAHEGELRVEDVLTPERPAPVRESVAEQIDAVGTGAVQSRSEIARLLQREPTDSSVGRALDQLEDQGRWEKVDRGQWRRLAFATSSEVANGNVGAEAVDRLQRRLLGDEREVG